ncbi:MAG TPA: hypothetical protein PLO16_09825 [Acidocella sp.]|nr:hypothetical protein [Acidocella sp.]
MNGQVLPAMLPVIKHWTTNALHLFEYRCANSPFITTHTTLCHASNILDSNPVGSAANSCNPAILFRTVIRAFLDAERQMVVRKTIKKGD